MISESYCMEESKLPCSSPVQVLIKKESEGKKYTHQPHI